MYLNNISLYFLSFLFDNFSYNRHLLGISYSDHNTSEKVRMRVNHQINGYNDVLTTIKKLKVYSHVTRKQSARPLKDRATRNREESEPDTKGRHRRTTSSNGLGIVLPRTRR